jgi:hypothetical protein
MKKSLLLVIVCLQCSICTLAQSQNNDIIKCINSLGKGDTIQFGPPSHEYQYLYVIKEGIPQECPEKIREKNLSSKEYKIKNFSTTNNCVIDAFPTHAPKLKDVISFGKKGGFIFGVTYYADIYAAIESGEIIIKKCQIQKEKSE